MFLRFAYTAFIGILLALFIGVGIAAFYPSPKSPENNYYPLSYPMKEASQSAAEVQQIRQRDKAYQDFNEISKDYSKNVSMIALLFAIVILVLSLIFLKSIYIMSDAFLLGGVLTLLYSIIRGFGVEDNIYRFMVTGIGLVIALLLGYLKIVRSSKS